jgi:pimeloyl-ACP methyl ester carboxylesterase
VRGFQGPFVVAVGDADPLLSVDEARAVADLAPQGRLELFPGAGHLVSVEQPEEFNGVLLDFVGNAR